MSCRYGGSRSLTPYFALPLYGAGRFLLKYALTVIVVLEIAGDLLAGVAEAVDPALRQVEPAEQVRRNDVDQDDDADDERAPLPD
jgi:hypothetical protein